LSRPISKERGQRRDREMRMVRDGILIVDKPPGLTSHDAVTRVKRALSAKKVGHTGTLDPFATGVLVMGINQGTKLIPFLDNTDKAYRGVVTLGVSTDTYDSTGEVVERCEEADLDGVSEGDILGVIDGFIGTIKQRPPIYSAVKLNGVRLYKLARSGVTVDVEEREVTIFSLELVKYDRPRITLDITCSPGTYIRSLAVDMGKALGLPAHLESLTRTRSGPFSIEDATALGDFTELREKAEVVKGVKGSNGNGAGWGKVIGLREAVGDMAELSVTEEEADRIMNGAPLFVGGSSFIKKGTTGNGDAAVSDGEVVKLVHRGKLLALARISIKSMTEEGRESGSREKMKINLKPFKVFH
jgi:tRNA pseudouridine55 synthase